MVAWTYFSNLTAQKYARTEYEVFIDVGYISGCLSHQSGSLVDFIVKKNHPLPPNKREKLFLGPLKCLFVT